MSRPFAQRLAKSTKRCLVMLSAITLSSTIFSASAQSIRITPDAPEINAKGFILIDYTTGKVIAEGNADERLEPASLTKMMTSYIIGRELEAGNIATTDMVTISENAWAKNFPDSSKMFIEVGTEVSVADLNQGIIVASGNDACVAMAEHIAGSEDAFADLMNAHAQQIGMNDSYFENSHGLHSQDHYTTARDMATLATALIRDTPGEYELYKQRSYTYNDIKQYNRNSLLWDKSLDVDGIKTGYHSKAGYSLVTSAVKDGMRLVSVVMGTESQRARKIENKKLLNYGFRFFETITPYEAGETFATNRVWMGDVKDVNLGILASTPITIPRGQRKKIETNVELTKELVAPLAKGEQVGKLYLTLNGEDIAEYPLVTLQEVNEGSMFSRLVDYVKLQFIE
ncbi:D-alanyl-D-alanine carboxypeptidase [Thalassotalea euphylliae]|uniref:serine-type D-Ala-D-Ala carboxypeptidase n=1 Tax=Thalassotalea euphylliae TaxID=1655234 RepID=A0A3E0TNQ0_9GAMM|nr:D-alanyl-D-alanine carboxypeptidase [Thalassotalea euphylliae]